MLGVTLSYEKDIAVKENVEKLLEKTECILQSWTNRTLTLSGKILLINSLVASLFIYKMSVLQFIPKQWIDKFNSITSNFLWLSKRAKIPGDVLRLPREHGGLRLVDLVKRDKSIKVQWIETIMEDEFFAKVAYQKLGDIDHLIWECNLKDTHIKILFEDCFWRDVLLSWSACNFYSPTTIEEIDSQTLWYNSHLLIEGKPFLFNRARRAGLRYVSQLYYTNGTAISFQDYKDEFGDTLTWLELNQIFSAIPITWRQQMRNSTTGIEPVTLFQDFTPFYKITNKAYNKMIQNKERVTKYSEKWTEMLNDPIKPGFFLKCFKGIVSVTISTKLRDFQYRMLLNKIFTNTTLSKWGKKDTELCDFCKAERETPIHLFIECRKITPIWSKLKQYIRERFEDQGSVLLFSNKNIILNCVHPKFGSVINMIILITKQTIFRSKCQGTMPQWEHIKDAIELTQKIE